MQMFGQGYLVVLLAIRDGVPQLAPLYLGLVGLARAIPGLTFGLFGGAMADRTDRRLLLMVTQSSAAVTAAVLTGLSISDRITIVEILMLGAFNSTVFAFDAPTRQSMVPRLVPERHLVSAIGLNSAAFNAPQIVGPVAVTALFARPYLQLLPAVAHDTLHVGAVELSWMLAASGVGSLAGALATAALGGVRRRGSVLVAAGTAVGILLVLFTLQTMLVLALPILLLLGFSTMIFIGMSSTLLQTRSPDHLRGRVMSVQSMVFMGLMPLGSTVMGTIGSAVGTSTALRAGGAICAVVALYAALRVVPLRATTGPRPVPRPALPRPASHL